MSIVLFPCLTYETLTIGLEEREAGVVRKASGGNNGDGAEY